MPSTQTRQVLRRGILGAIDDSQLLTSAAFDGWLHQPAPTPGDEVQGFDDDPLAALFGQPLPSRDHRRLGRGVGQIEDPGGGHLQARIG
jgi:hypothetical protein